jgi:protein-histidine pros-kinase
MVETSRLFCELADQSSEALFALSLTGVVLTWNRGAEMMFGFAADEAKGGLFSELIVPEGQRREAVSRLATIAEGSTSVFELQRRHKNGAAVQAVVTMRRVDPPAGDSYLVVSTQDVTTLRRLERQDVDENLFRNLLEAAPDAIVIVNGHGDIHLVNGQTEKLFGYQRDDLIGQSVEMLVPPRFRAPHTFDQRSYFADPHARSIGSGMELCGQRKDGSEFPIEVNLAPLRSGNVTLISGAIRDLTGRKKAEEKFRGLLESAPDAMVIVNAQGHIVLVNAQTEKLFGYSRAALVGARVEMLIPEGYRDAEETLRGDVAEPHVRVIGAGPQLYGKHEDGTAFPVEVSLSPLQTEDGLLVSMAIRDITERKLIEEKLAEASRLKSAFLANMSHELRTPLNAIIGFAELMHKGKSGPMAPDHHEYLGDILTSAKHLLQLINDVLDLAKVESGNLEFEPEPVELPRLVGEVCDVLRGLASRKRLAIQIEIDDQISRVLIDAARIKQVLYNFVSNAIKFTKEGGTITVRMGQASDPAEFRIDVEDTGVGISADDVPKLFVEFQQLDTGAAKRFQGTGLGLALTKRLVEGHHGRVEVKSTLGVGSTFSAILPRAWRTGGLARGR